MESCIPVSFMNNCCVSLHVRFFINHVALNIESYFNQLICELFLSAPFFPFYRDKCAPSADSLISPITVSLRLIMNQLWRRSFLQETFIQPHVPATKCVTVSTGIDLPFPHIIVYRFIYRNNNWFCWWLYIYFAKKTCAHGSPTLAAYPGSPAPAARPDSPEPAAAEPPALILSSNCGYPLARGSPLC